MLHLGRFYFNKPKNERISFSVLKYSGVFPFSLYQYAAKALNYYRSANDWKGIAGVLCNTHRRLKRYSKSIDCYLECVG